MAKVCYYEVVIISLDGLSAYVIIMVLLALPFFVVSPLVRQASRRREQAQELTSKAGVADTAPPDGLTPAEVGYLYGNGAGQRELFATVLDLERRGIITLTPDNLGVTATPTSLASAPMSGFEAYFMSQLGAGKKLNQSFVVPFMPAFAEQLKQELVIKDLAYKNPAQGYLIRAAKLAVKLTIVLPIVLIITFPFHASLTTLLTDILLTMSFTLVMLPGYFLIGLLLAGIYTHVAGQSWVGPQRLALLWPKLEEYRTFVEQVELDGLKFASAQAQADARARSLPFAVALGLYTGWKARFRAND